MNIKTKTCSTCGKTKAVDLFEKQRNQCRACRNAYMKERYKNNPALREKTVARSKEYRKNNPEKGAAWDKKYNKKNAKKNAERSKEYRKNNPEKRAASEKNWRKNNPEKVAEYDKKYKKNNLDKTNATAAKYRASKLQRTPGWYDHEKVESVYAEAQRLTKEAGIKHEVDHVLPLQGDRVSGLHVYDNLQILTESENRSKSNKYDTSIKNIFDT